MRSPPLSTTTATPLYGHHTPYRHHHIIQPMINTTVSPTVQVVWPNPFFVIAVVYSLYLMLNKVFLYIFWLF